jgi:hypothetical protein
LGHGAYPFAFPLAGAPKLICVEPVVSIYMHPVRQEDDRGDPRRTEDRRLQ